MSPSAVIHAGGDPKRDAGHLDSSQPIHLVPTQYEDSNIEVCHAERETERITLGISFTPVLQHVDAGSGGKGIDGGLSIDAIAGHQPVISPVLKTRCSPCGPAFRGPTYPRELSSSDFAPPPSLLENRGRSWNARGSTYDLELGGRSTHKLHINETAALNDLGYKSWHRTDRSDVDESVGLGAKMDSVGPGQYDDQARRHCDLVNVHLTLFDQSGGLSSLNEAIKYQTKAVGLTSANHADKAPLLSGLARIHRIRFEHQANLLDLHRSIEFENEAIALISDGHIGQPDMVNSLGVSYLARFQVLGGLMDLNKSIECGERAASLTPDSCEIKAERLGNLGSAYLARFKHLGDLLDLNKSIDYGANAIALASDTHGDKPRWLETLGNSYLTRFERLGELPDLRKAIGHGEAAVSLTPDGHKSKPGRFGHLGDSYLARFERIGELGDLNKAIEYEMLALSLTPQSHPNRPSVLSNLGRAYLARFEHRKEVPDINNSIDCGVEAVSATPDGHTDRPRRLGILGNAYLARSRRLDQPTDLNRAIKYFTEVVSLVPDGLASKPRWLASLGNAYYSRYEFSQSISDIESAVVYYKMAGQLPTGSPMFRFQACREWARLSFRYRAFSPYLAYQQAMNLLPQLVWIGTSVDRRYSIITEVGDLATEAASHAIAIGSYGRALEWLEAGRSIVWGQIAQLRTPVDELAIQRPELADRIREVGRRLEHTTSESSESSMHGAKLESDSSRHHELAVEWERLLGEARSVPGFEHFLSPPTLSQLLGIVQSHPIVVINIHESRCDALILQPNSKVVSHIPLTEFSTRDAALAFHHTPSQVRDSHASNPGELKSSLKKLWFSVVRPVLDFLGYTRELPVEQLPRITWCTTGLLSFLPLHAVGCYDGSSPHTFDLVVSSYIPTLSTLLRLQSITPREHCGIVAIGQEHTPGLDSLPFVWDELKTVRKHAHDCLYVGLESDEATVDRVLDAMDQFSWVHLACHGSQNSENPMRSSFHLHDGNLTLSAISKRSFPGKGLAFLSACETATGDTHLPDEAVHLAAGLLAAGYESVIGTMWSLADEDGPEVADLVYAELLKDGKMDHRESARALHRAVAQLRCKIGEGNLVRWASFIHIGS